MKTHQAIKILNNLAQQLFNRKVSVSVFFISEGGSESKKQELMRKYIDLVSFEFSILPNELMSRSRRRPVADAKKVLQYLMRKKLDLSLPDIGRMSGGYDHSTVIHNLKEFEYLLETNKQFRQKFTNIINKINIYENDQKEHAVSCAD